ncbi:FtsX-like permease family protein [Micromonospora sp. LOL_024]|uniref:FtsX-like permease family protein n=1 Tax=Micromonospora sp. LOL_024 TaxID=3345412 RepID=UPI003A8C222E
MSAADGRARRGRLAWVGDLALGVRLSVAGGRSGWTRLALISTGVGLGVALLLTASALPTVGASRDNRSSARMPGPEVAAAGPDTLLYAVVRSQYRDVRIEGRLLRPEGDRAPVPPGLDRLPAPGEITLSPALAQLWNSPDGGLLRERWGGQVVGVIGPAGLTGSREHFFYLGTDQLSKDPYHTQRISAFGGAPGESDGLPPVLLVLTALGLVVLLLPVMIFVTTAVRFGSEARDRQLAALRLVGADVTMTRLVAAGETLVGAVLGMGLGILVFLGVGPLVGELVPDRFSFYRADLRPVPMLVALVVLLVPVSAVAVTLSALRQVLIEPLGVVRRGVARGRRLWWRLIPPVLGLLLLAPLLGGLPQGGGPIVEAQITAGLTLLLVGIALLLPWLVQAVVRQLGGGGVAWELAVRRLRLDSDTAVRAVAGIAVSVAGVIAVQGVLGAAQAQLSTTPAPADRFQATVYATSASEDQLRDLPQALAELPGVRAVGGVSHLGGSPETAGRRIVLGVADCVALAQYAELGTCADGDSFAVGGQDGAVAGMPLTFEDRVQGAQWTVPADIRPVQLYSAMVGSMDFLVTPAALDFIVPAPDTVHLGLEPSDPDALERVRNVAARTDPFAAVQSVENQHTSTLLASVQQAVQVGAVALLLLIGASLLVNVLEQLRERRRLLAVLAAFGTRRRTLSWSVLYQVGIPVALGLALAVVTGSGLAAMLLSVVGEPVGFDWAATAGVSGAAALMVLAVTAASLPLLWRLTAAEGLRSE